MLGWLWGRIFIQRIFALTHVTRSIAEGKLDERVAISGQDEIRELGDAFNSMADRLVELQDDIRKQERQVMFGRIAAGLVHDLSHPIQNIGNSCKLIVKMWDDANTARRSAAWSSASCRSSSACSTTCRTSPSRSRSSGSRSS